MRKFFKGKYYQSGKNSMVIRCLEDSITESFKGVIVAKYLSTEEPGTISIHWDKSKFLEINYIGDTSLGNNGWVKIESEKDLPKESKFYPVGNLKTPFEFVELNGKLTKEEVEYNYRHGKITHYRMPVLPPNF